MIGFFITSLLNYVCFCKLPPLPPLGRMDGVHIIYLPVHNIRRKGYTRDVTKPSFSESHQNIRVTCQSDTKTRKIKMSSPPYLYMYCNNANSNLAHGFKDQFVEIKTPKIEVLKSHDSFLRVSADDLINGGLVICL